MSEAYRDENYVTVLLAVSLIDLLTPVNVAVNPLNNAIIVELG